MSDKLDQIFESPSNNKSRYAVASHIMLVNEQYSTSKLASSFRVIQISRPPEICKNSVRSEVSLRHRMLKWVAESQRKTNFQHLCGAARVQALHSQKQLHNGSTLTLRHTSVQIYVLFVRRLSLLIYYCMSITP